MIKFRNKIVAAAICSLFVGNNLVYPQQTSTASDTIAMNAGMNSPSAGRLSIDPATSSLESGVNAYNISVPEQFGQIEEVFQGNASSPLVVHIQNVHANYEAQVNIKKILNHLVEQYQFSLIQLEGAVSRLDPAILQPSYLKEANLKLVDFLMREGRITGADAFAVETDQPVEVYGIEDYSLYVENLKMFKAVYQHQEELKPYFDEIHRLILSIGPKLLKPEPLDFTRKTEEFSTDKIDLLDYLVYMNKLSEKHELTSLNDLAQMVDYPNLTRLMRLKNLEEELNQAGLQKETEAIKLEFQKKMPDSSQVDELLSHLGETAKGVNPRTYFLKLTKLADEAKVDFIAYPAFRIFAEFLIHQDEIDHRALFSELKQFEHMLQDNLFGTEDEKLFLSVIDKVGLLEQFFRLEMSREKIALYLKDKEIVKPSWISANLEALAKKNSVAVKPTGDIQKLDSYMSEVEYFYQLVLKRDEVFIDKILTKTKSLSLDKTIIVTGGFHKDGLVDYFRKENISYVIINPKVDVKEGNQNYLKVMLEDDAVAGSVFAGTFAMEVKNFLDGLFRSNPQLDLTANLYAATAALTRALDSVPSDKDFISKLNDVQTGASNVRFQVESATLGDMYSTVVLRIGVLPPEGQLYGYRVTARYNLDNQEFEVTREPLKQSEVPVVNGAVAQPPSSNQFTPFKQNQLSSSLARSEARASADEIVEDVHHLLTDLDAKNLNISGLDSINRRLDTLIKRILTFYRSLEDSKNWIMSQQTILRTISDFEKVFLALNELKKRIFLKAAEIRRSKSTFKGNRSKMVSSLQNHGSLLNGLEFTWEEVLPESIIVFSEWLEGPRSLKHDQEFVKVLADKSRKLIANRSEARGIIGSGNLDFVRRELESRLTAKYDSVTVTSDLLFDQVSVSMEKLFERFLSSDRSRVRNYTDVLFDILKEQALLNPRNPNIVADTGLNSKLTYYLREAGENNQLLFIEPITSIADEVPLRAEARTKIVRNALYRAYQTSTQLERSSDDEEMKMLGYNLASALAHYSNILSTNPNTIGNIIKIRGDLVSWSNFIKENLKLEHQNLLHSNLNLVDKEIMVKVNRHLKRAIKLLDQVQVLLRSEARTTILPDIAEEALTLNEIIELAPVVSTFVLPNRPIPSELKDVVRGLLSASSSVAEVLSRMKPVVDDDDDDEITPEQIEAALKAATALKAPHSIIRDEHIDQAASELGLSPERADGLKAMLDELFKVTSAKQVEPQILVFPITQTMKPEAIKAKLEFLAKIVKGNPNTVSAFVYASAPVKEYVEAVLAEFGIDKAKNLKLVQDIMQNDAKLNQKLKIDLQTGAKYNNEFNRLAKLLGIARKTPAEMLNEGYVRVLLENNEEGQAVSDEIGSFSKVVQLFAPDSSMLSAGMNLEAIKAISAFGPPVLVILPKNPDDLTAAATLRQSVFEAITRRDGKWFVDTQKLGVIVELYQLYQRALMIAAAA